MLSYFKSILFPNSFPKEKNISDSFLSANSEGGGRDFFQTLFPLQYNSWKIFLSVCVLRIHVFYIKSDNAAHQPREVK